ncbi:MAG: glycoside hydrolase family 13 protein [Ruminococcaceae bacterium]|nr:glycoside hydrolase family 13 protein [Oscillospiraceae bacterium]
MINEIEFFHDTRELTNREPYGAIEAGSNIKLRLLALAGYGFTGEISVNIHFTADTTFGNLSFDVPMKKQVRINKGRIQGDFTAEIDSFDSPGVYFYYFVINIKESERFDAPVQRVYYGNNKLGSGGLGKIYYENPNSYQVTVYEKGNDVPHDILSSVIYQIFPDRFYRSGKVDIYNCGRVNGDIRVYENWNDKPQYNKNEKGDIVQWDFFGGDLYGVEEKLDYINELGVDKIYLNPIFEAASNHRYDTANYKSVDPILGGEEAFDFLIKSCKERNIDLILDGVFSHTGEDSIYFDHFGHYNQNGAYLNNNSPYRSWFRFKHNDDDYECWWNCKALPNVNETDPSYMDYIITGEDSVIKHWLNKGVYGFRLDVADELPDQFIAALRNELDNSASGEKFLLGEVWEDASNKISYNVRRQYFTKKELHSVTNYVFRDSLLSFLIGEIPARDLWSKFLSLKENYPVHNFYSVVNMTGTHDVTRLFTILKDFTDGNEDYAFKLHVAYAAVLFTFTGIPLVYYGDEVCMEGRNDPDNRRPYPWNNVKHPRMLELFRIFGQLRKDEPVLHKGLLRIISPIKEDENLERNIFAFERHFNNGINAFSENVQLKDSESDSIVTVINREYAEKTVKLSGFIPGFMYVSIKTNKVYTVDDEGYIHIVLGDADILKRIM